MQSVSRRLRRGNAVITFSEITKQNELIDKKGTEAKLWKHAVRNQLKEAAISYCLSITKPITADIIEKAREKKKKYIVNVD